MLGREGEFYRLRFHVDEPLDAWLQHAGRLPLPPYIRREPGADDDARYQTVFAREPGAVAAPTAGLHFDEALLDALRARGVDFGHVTLHVGAGTFQPVRVDDLDRAPDAQRMAERRRGAGGESARARATRGGRVSPSARPWCAHWKARCATANCSRSPAKPASSSSPAYRIRSIDALLTNFHLPESTLLMLVSAFAGRERIFAAYAHAIARALPVLLLWRCDVAVSAGGAGRMSRMSLRTARAPTAPRAAAA